MARYERCCCCHGFIGSNTGLLRDAMKTVGMFTALLATWHATANASVEGTLGAMPESVGMVVWGVSLLALAAAARHVSTKRTPASK